MLFQARWDLLQISNFQNRLNNFDYVLNIDRIGAKTNLFRNESTI